MSSGISQASAGDTVIVRAGTYSGFTVNKSVSVIADPGVTITGDINISASNSVVKGFYVDGGGIGAAGHPTSGPNPSNVWVLDNHTYRSDYHCWINGTNWIVEGNEFERVVFGGGGGDADYCRMFGTGHVFRRNYLHGTTYGYGQDIEPNGPHTDCIQYYGNNGGVLKNVTIELNFFTDIFQGMLIADERRVDDIQNLTIRDNVFWGTQLPNSGNMHGRPSWGIYIGKNHGSRNVVLEHNLIYNCNNYFGLNGDAEVALGKNIVAGLGAGTVYNLSSGAGPNIVELGSILHNYNYIGGINPSSNIKANPNMRDPSNPLGPDGKPMTSDDGWLPTSAFAKSFGPRIILDSDGDFLDDDYEINVSLTDPNNPDTDNDGFYDGIEVQYGTDPLDPGSVPPLPANNTAMQLALSCGLLAAGVLLLLRFTPVARAISFVKK